MYFNKISCFEHVVLLYRDLFSVQLFLHQLEEIKSWRLLNTNSYLFHANYPENSPTSSLFFPFE